MRSGSITGPLILVAIGVIFLLNNLGHDIPVWSYLADYWPFLLIGIGVIQLAEVLLHFSRGSQLPARSGGSGLFWIVVLVIVLVAWNAGRGGIHIGPFGASNGISVLGSSFDYDVNADSSALGVTRLVLDNINGDVNVHGGSGSDVKVTGRKTVHAFSQSAADRADKGSQVHLVREGDALVLRADEPPRPGMLSISTELDVTAPAGLNVESRSGGDLKVQDMTGAVSVTGSRGDVRLTNIGRDVRVEDARGGLVQADDVRGAVDVQGRGGDVQIEKVDGAVTVNGEFSGTLEFRTLAKPLHFESSHTDFRAEQIPGSVTMDLGDLKLDNVAGPVLFRTMSRDIEADNVSDSLEINVDRGDIDVSASKLPLPKMDVHSHNGDIVLTLPDHAAFSLDGKTAAGDASNDFGSPLEQRNDGQSATITGRIGSGPQLTVVTDRGSLSVKKR